MAQSEYEQRLERVVARRRELDPDVRLASRVNEVFEQLSGENEGTRYALQAMQPVDPASTSRSFQEGDRVKNQLEKGLDDNCDYRYQGSTAQDTHIKARSDVDLLVLTGKFFYCEHPLEPRSPYKGDPEQDVRTNKVQAKNHLENTFPTADVESGTKSVKISGGSLYREVDVVPAAWVNTVDSEASGREADRKVKILDTAKSEFVTNAPFLIRDRIEQRDRQANGGLRKTIRLMKSLKYDTQKTFDLSSFDLCAIAYAMPPEDVFSDPDYDVRLVGNAKRFVDALQAEPHRRRSIRAIDDSRAIFAEGDERAERGLDHLSRELDRLTEEIAAGSARSFGKLAEARRIEYDTRPYRYSA